MPQGDIKERTILYTCLIKARRNFAFSFIGKFIW